MKTFIETAMECGAKMKVFNCTFAGTKSCPCEEQNIDNCVSRKAHSVVINEAQFQATFDAYCKQFEPVAWNFEYEQLTEEFIHELDDKTAMSISGFNRGYWAQYFNAKPQQIPSDFKAKLEEIMYAMRTKAANNVVIKDTTLESFADEIEKALADTQQMPSEAKANIESMRAGTTIINLFKSPEKTSEVKAYIARLEILAKDYTKWLSKSSSAPAITLQLLAETTLASKPECLKD